MTDRNHHIRHFAADNGATLFERDFGVLCIEVRDIVPARRSVDDVWGFVNTLEMSGLEWVWDHDCSNNDGGLPTVLTSSTQDGLLTDILDRNGERHWRSTTLVGVDQGAAYAVADPTSFSSTLRNFAESEDGPIRVVIFHIADMREQYVFVPHVRVEAVDALLVALGVDPNEAPRRREYRVSSGITLEALYRAL
ncbi:MAG TPA: hypothetical protein VN706_17135 [Gemmatimonadaceae bacterium]|nr:hypothetical protein [Gemmatimonadaceae bacterium]